MYKDAIIKHNTLYWQSQPDHCFWKKWPIEKLPPDFRVLVFSPTENRNAWIYATCCMSQPADKKPVELHLFSSKEDDSLVELLVKLAYYHRNIAAIDLYDTVDFGNGWKNNAFNYGYVSRPYKKNGLENCRAPDGRIINCYWLITTTMQKAGAENRYDYADPHREKDIAKNQQVNIHGEAATLPFFICKPSTMHKNNEQQPMMLFLYQEGAKSFKDQWHDFKYSYRVADVRKAIVKALETCLHSGLSFENYRVQLVTCYELNSASIVQGCDATAA